MSLMQNLTPLPTGGRADQTATYDARALIGDGMKAEIILDGQTYTLRITRAGKLILTK